MANILMVYGSTEPTNIMLIHFFQSMSQKNKMQVRHSLAVTVCEEDLIWSDLVIGIRTQNRLEAEILHIAKKAKRKVVEFIDDNLLELKDYHIRRPIQENALKMALSSSDLIMSYNKELCCKLCKQYQNTKGIVIDSAVAEEEICVSSLEEKDIIDVAYYVSGGGTEHFERLIFPIMEELYVRYGKRVHWTFFTVHPDLSQSPYKDCVTYLPSMSLEEFRKTLSERGFSIGIAPLLEDEFTKGKYVNKFFEFSRAGIPGIYSKVKPYDGFITDGEDGILCENSKEGWIFGFERLIEHNIRHSIVKKSQEELRTRFSQETIEKKLLKDMPELENYHAPEVKITGLKAAKRKERVCRILDPFARALGRMRVEGIGSVIRWTWKRYIFPI